MTSPIYIAGLAGMTSLDGALGRLQTDWQTAQSLVCSHESEESGTVSKKFARQGIFGHDSCCIKHDKAFEAKQIQKHTVMIPIHLLFVSCGAQLQQFSSDSRLNFLACKAGINRGMELNLINFSMICFLEESMTWTDIWARYSSFFLPFDVRSHWEDTGILFVTVCELQNATDLQFRATTIWEKADTKLSNFTWAESNLKWNIW